MLSKRWLPLTALTVVVAAAGGCRDDDDYVSPTVEDGVVVPTTPTREPNEEFGDTITDDDLYGETTTDGSLYDEDSEEDLYSDDDLYGERGAREGVMPMDREDDPYDQTMPREAEKSGEAGQEIPGPTVEYEEEDN